MFWLKTQLNRLFWTVPEYSMSLCAPLGFCSRQHLMPRLCHLVHRGVAKWPLKEWKKSIIFSSKVDLLYLFCPLWCNSAIVLFVYTLFFLFLPSTHSLTCAQMRSSHYFTWQGDVKFALLTPSLSPPLSRTFCVDVLGAQILGVVFLRLILLEIPTMLRLHRTEVFSIAGAVRVT